MSTSVLDDLTDALDSAEDQSRAVETVRREQRSREEIAAELRDVCFAVRLRRQKFGLRKTLSTDQRMTAAQVFEADVQRVAASKKVLDDKQPAYKKVNKILSNVMTYWRNMTIPCPEEGVRMLHRDRLEVFEGQMAEFQQSLARALQHLEADYERLIDQSRERLGQLFNRDDYPARISDQFRFEYSVVNVEPPDYLKHFSPELYRREQDRVSKMFDEVVDMTETMLTEELANLVEKLVSALETTETGERKRFRNSSVENLQLFFERFRQLNLGSSAELDVMVDRCRQLAEGVNLKQLRESGEYRDRVRTSFEGVAPEIERLIEVQPRRRFRFGDNQDEKGAQ